MQKTKTAIVVIAAVIGVWAAWYSWNVIQSRHTLDKGRRLLEQGNVDAAIEQFRASVRALEAAGIFDERLYAALKDLAAAYIARGMFLEAEALLLRVVQEATARLGPHSRDVAQAFDSIAELRIRRQQRDGAETALWLSVESWRGANDPVGLSKALLKLAGTLRQHGKLAEAKSFYAEAMAVQEKGEFDVETLNSTRKAYASLLRDMGAVDEAERIENPPERAGEAPPPALEFDPNLGR